MSFVKNKKTNIALSIVMMIIVAVLLVNVFVSYAKYVDQNSSTQMASVADFEFVVGNLTSGGEECDLALQTMNPLSPTQTYTFNVSNGTLARFSEVAVVYKIEISKTDNLPLIVVLKNTSNETLISLSTTIHTLSTTWISIEGGQFLSHGYTLEISWSDLDSSASYDHQNLVDSLAVKVDYSQLD